MNDLVMKISEFLTVAADLIERLSVATPPMDQMDVRGSHVASRFRDEHGCRMISRRPLAFVLSTEYRV